MDKKLVILELYNSGATQSRIAQVLDIDLSYVSMVVNRKVPERVKSKEFKVLMKPDTIKSIVEAYFLEPEMSFTDVARHLVVTPDQVRKIWTAKGFPFKRMKDDPS